MTFDKWLTDLRAVIIADTAYGAPADYIEQTGRDCWRDYYEDDFTPEDAWASDKSHAEEDVG